MRAPWWWRRKPRPAGTVTVELVADTTRFVEAMDRASETIAATAYEMRVAHEWSLAEAYVGVQLDELARRSAERAWLAEHRAHRRTVQGEEA